MPTSPLLVLTSPMLLGPVAPVAAVEISAMVPHPVAAQAEFTPQPILLLDWSLQEPPEVEDAQSEDETPQGEGNEIVVEGEYGPSEGDPMAEFNETSYRITQDLDAAITGPIAYAYRDGLPDPIRDGLGNVVRNLGEPANFLNFLLQFKFGDAIETLGRFAINSTLGIGGLFDIAGEPGINLPYRRNGFANTMGFYGVDTGGYLYLPITGATTVRDLIGNTLDQAVLPIAVGRPFSTPEYAVPYFIVSNLDARLEVDEELIRIGQTVDPYAARRDTYLYRRERDIALLRGEEPPEPPAILREVEEGVDALDNDETLDTPHTAPVEPSEETLEPSGNVAITRLRTR